MKYFIATFGCQMNKSDSERIAAVLESAGYKPTPKMELSDLAVVNMCSVRQSAVDRIYGLTPKFKGLKNKNQKFRSILTGCILSFDKKKLAPAFDFVLDIKYLRKWPKILSTSSPALISGKELLKENNYLKIKPKYSNNHSVYVPIMTGCNNFCAYCVVPSTRGKEISRPAKEIIREAKKAVENGAKEIWLLGQNVNTYNGYLKSSQAPCPSVRLDSVLKINFAKLFKMVENIRGNFKIFFLSPNPNDFSQELINVLAKSKKFSRYLNLPLQSGDNKILKKMNRQYTAERYKTLVRKLREKIPDINLSTDVIVGFPGETRKQFENTAKLFREVNFNIAYIAKYSPRPGTAAYKMKDDVPIKEKKRREKILQEIINQKLKTKNQKLITILGPTSSGKTALSIKLAKKFGGEIVSADSRQVYKGMDIGTGKITKKEMRGIPHYLLDVVSPKKRFDVVQYRKLALAAIEKIFKRNKVPFLVGGTGFYIQAVVDGIIIPEVKPDWNLRQKLEKKPLPELYKMLVKLDPKRAKSIDKNNPRRIIRALEIVLKTKRPVPPFQVKKPAFKVLFLGVKKSKKELKKLIEKRLLKRLEVGMVEEVKKLHKSGISFKRLEEFGLEYRFVAQYLQGKLKYDEMVRKLQKEIEHYAKRQMTWFSAHGGSASGGKRDKRIKWVKTSKQAEKLVREFLS